jgi:hypothetical protein
LASQLQSIELLRKKKTSSKLLLASALAAQISATEASIIGAIRLFTVCGHPINKGEGLLRFSLGGGLNRKFTRKCSKAN